MSEYKGQIDQTEMGDQTDLESNYAESIMNQSLYGGFGTSAQAIDKNQNLDDFVEELLDAERVKGK